MYQSVYQISMENVLLKARITLRSVLSFFIKNEREIVQILLAIVLSVYLIGQRFFPESFTP